LEKGDAVRPPSALCPLKNKKTLKIQDGGARHLEKSKNRKIAAVCRISTEFGTATRFDPLEPSDR